MFFFKTLILLFAIAGGCYGEDVKKCRLINGEWGECVVPKECATIKTQLKNKEITHAQIQKCGRNVKTMLICCPQPSVDNSTDENYSELYDQFTTDSPITVQKYEQFCEKISQQSDASSDNEETAHFVSIGYRNTRRSSLNMTYMCSGSLISHNFVLSAAHCFAKINMIAVAVKLGLNDIQTEVGSSESNEVESSRIVMIKSIFYHPGYESGSKSHNIALAQLTEEITFTANIKPICLPSLTSNNNDDIQENSFKTIGILVDELSNNSLIILQDISPMKCNQTSSKQEFSEYLICIANKDGKYIDKNSCEEFDGSPLMKMEKSNGKLIHQLVGVASSGSFCDENSMVYTRVFEYVGWIESIVWPGTENS